MHRGRLDAQAALPAALLLGGIVASFGGLAVQLGFAGVALVALGLPHGAGDLAIVAPQRRPAFIAAYVAALAAIIGWWLVRPDSALPVFLIASAVHFAWEDDGDGGSASRIIRGVAPIALPAALHHAGFAMLLTHAAGDARIGEGIAAVLHPLGLALLPVVAWLAWRTRDRRLAVAGAALLALPPLIGFSIGFLLLHALPQTDARARALGCTGWLDFHRRVLPVMAAALACAASGGALLLAYEPSGVRLLFAGIAALAMPHMIVTPLFETNGKLRTATAGGLIVAHNQG